TRFSRDWSSDVCSSDLDIYTPYQRVTEDSIIFFTPIVNQEGRDPLGWVEVELLTAPYLVMRYQTLLIASFVTLLCLLLAAWLAVNLHNNISTPLTHIRRDRKSA